MKFRYFFGLLFFAGFALFQSCDKTEYVPLPHYTFSDEFKSYALFEIGSKWEYQGSQFEGTTEVLINDKIENKWTNSFGEQYTYDAVDMLSVDNKAKLSMIEITAQSTLNATTGMVSQMWLFYSNGDYRLIFAPQYPLGEEQLLGEHEGKYVNLEIIPSLTLGNNTYSDVYHTQITDYLESGIGDFDIYIAKNYGLVKMLNITGNDTISLELVSSSLVQ